MSHAESRNVASRGAAMRKLSALLCLAALNPCLTVYPCLAVSPRGAQGAEPAAMELSAGVRAVVGRAPSVMKMDGDLSPFKDAFCTPIEYFNADRKNRPAQFLYLWNDEAFYAGLRTLDEVKKQANPAPDNQLWEGDAVEWYFDTRRGDDFRGTQWGPGAVHCYWTALKGRELKPRFCLRPGYLDAIPKTGVQVAARRWAHGLEVEFKLPWVNFPKFKPRVGEVIALDAEACYSDGGRRVYRSFAFGSPLSVSHPASLAKVQLVDKVEPAYWRQCGPEMMPMRVDVPWDQKETKADSFAQIAVPPNQGDQIGRVLFRVVDLYGKTLSEHEAKQRETLVPGTNFAVLTAHWPVDDAPPGRHHVLAIVYDKQGKELTRIAPRLMSTNMTPGY